MGASVCTCCWPELPPVGDRDPAAVADAVRLLDRVYERHGFDWAYKIGKIREARAQSYQLFGSENAGVYGELHPFSVVSMLFSVCAQPGQRFYDLGSGTGKVVLLAKLLGLNATGIELFEERWDASCKALQRLKELAPECDGEDARFVHANVLDVDFSDADILFSTDVLWPPELRAGVAAAARQLRPGSIVVTNHPMAGPGFDLVTELTLVTSWNATCPYRVQVVTGVLADQAAGEGAGGDGALAKS